MINLESGDLLEGDAAIASKIDYSITGYRYVSGGLVEYVATGQLAATKGTLVTVKSGERLRDIIIRLVNTDSTARTVNLYVKADETNSRRLIPKDLSLGAGYAAILDSAGFHVYNTGGNVLTFGETGPAPAGKVFLSAAGATTRISNGCATAVLSETTTNKINYYTLDFDKTADEYAQWSFAMPSDWDGGTVTAVVYWTFATGSAAETVNFAIKGGSFGNDDAIDTALGTAQACTDTAITAGDSHITAASAAITIANAAASEWVVIECMRDVSEDNLAGDAQLIGIMLTFTRS